MKRFSGIVLLFLMGCLSDPAVSQRLPSVPDLDDAISDSQAEFRDHILYCKGSETPFTGSTIRCYPGGSPETLVQWENGKVDGSTTVWYLNGTIKEQSNWRNGKTSGTFRQWDEKGNLVRFGDWETGRWISWDSKGNVIERELIPPRKK